MFVPTEVARAGMKWLSLADFGDVSRCDWFPPTMEEDLRTPAWRTPSYTLSLTGNGTSPQCCITVAHLRPGN